MITNIRNIKLRKNQYIYGRIKNIKILKRKSDEQELAFFTIEDQTGTIKCNCFTEIYKRYKHLIKENKNILISGNCFEEDGILTCNMKNGIRI